MIQRFVAAVRALEAGPLRDLRRAPLYRSSPVVRRSATQTAADSAQPDYLNTVVVGLPARHLARSLVERPERRAEAARQIVGWCKRLERRAGRRLDGPVDGPRPLDLDLLLLGDLQFRVEALAAMPEISPDTLWSGEIIVPHPRLMERRFVLRPLADLLPRLELPAADASASRSVREALAALTAESAAETAEQIVEPVRDERILAAWRRGGSGS